MYVASAKYTKSRMQHNIMNYYKNCVLQYHNNCYDHRSDYFYCVIVSTILLINIVLYRKAEEGYTFCINKLEKLVPTSVDEDILLLWAMTLDWYARFLHECNRLDEAFNNYKKAYDMCLQLNGEIHEQTVILLNDLGTISFLRGDNDNAIMYMTKAVETGKHLPNMEDFSSVYVNLGNIYIQKSMYSEASKSCKEGWQNAKRHKNKEGIKEANTCLEELRNILGK